MPATRRWRGNAPLVAQVTTVTIYHVEDGVVYTLTHGGKSVTYTADDEDTTTTVMAALAGLWNAGIVPQFSEITALASGSSITLTADNEGVPFDLTATQSGTGGNVEIKTVTIANSPTGGTWSWVDSTYGTVSGLVYNISAATLTTQLETLYGSGNVTATGSNGGPFTVTFGGDLAHENIPDITFVNTSLTGGNATVNVVETVKGTAGTDEVQTITFYGSPTTGTFTATFNGFTTPALAYNVSAADLQTALRNLASIGATGVTVSGSAGGPYTVTFAGTLANTAVSMITIDASGYMGGTIYGATATTTPGVDGVNEVQYISQMNSGATNETMTIEKTGTVSGGTFKLVYSGTNTSNIAYDAKLWEIIEALETAVETDEGSSYLGPYFAPWNEAYANLTISECIATGGAAACAIQFIGSKGGANISTADYSIDGALLTGGGSYSFPGSSSQAGSIGSGSLANTSTFTLSFGGQTTSALTLTGTFTGFTSPTVAQVQSALEGLSTIGTGNVLVTALSTPSSGSSGNSRGLFRVEFIGALAGTPVSQITGTGTVPAGQEANSYDISVATLKNGVAGTNEVQTVTISGTPSAGTFTLSYGSQTTAAIAYNAAASAVDSALEALSNIPAGGVTVTGSAGGPYTVTFTGELSYTDVSQLVINDSGLKAIVVETTPGVTTANEIQTITLTGSPHGGTATLTYSGQTTGALAYNAAAATIQTALEALSNLAPGDVVCTGGPWPAAVTLTFGATLAATDVAALTGTPSLNNGAVSETSINPIIYPTTTENSGPNDILVAANWSDETLPVAGDTVVFDQGSSPALYHLDQLPSGLAAFYHYARYTGRIGLPEQNTSFSESYYEFRPQYLVVDAPIIDIGIGDGNGSGRMKIKGVVGTAPTVNVHKTDTGLDEGIESLLLVLPNTSSVVNVNRGSVGIAIYPGETSTVPTLRVGFVENVNGDSFVRSGPGVTLTTIEQSGGKLTTQSNFVTLNMTAGELVHITGTATTLNIDGGAVRYNSSGTCTTANVGSGGVLDFQRDLRGRTVTNASMNEKASMLDPHGTVIFTNGVDFVRCTPADCVFEIKPNQTISLSSI